MAGQETGGGDGRRQLLSWLAWLALLAVLGGAGIVALDDGGPLAPPPAAVIAPAASVPPRPEPPEPAVPAAQRHLAVDSARPAATLPTLPAQCRLVYGASAPSVGNRFLDACTVVDDAGVCLAHLQAVTDPRPLAFALPIAARRVRFEAAGHRAAERDVPPLREGVLDFGTVVLEPDAGVRIRIERAPADWDGVAECRWQGSAIVLQPADFARDTVLPFPSGRDLELVVAGHGARTQQFAVALPRLRLRPGQIRDCIVDLQQLPHHRLRVVGPSPELLGQLSVAWEQSRPFAAGVVALAADGSAELWGLDPAQLSFRVDGVFQDGALQPIEPASHGELLLAPTARLLGLRVRGGDGTWLQLEPDIGHRGQPAKRLQPTTATAVEAEPQVCLAVAGTGRLRWPVPAIRWQQDLGTLELDAAVRGNLLEVTPVGPLPEQAHRFRLAVRGPDGATRVVSRFASAFRTSDLAPGSYSVCWQIGDQPGPVIDDALQIASGQRVALQVPWPAFAMWRGTVTNWRSIPVGDRFLCVRFGTWKSFADGAQPRIDDDGHFLLPLPDDSTGPDARVEFRTGTQGIDGRVVAVDVPGHRVMVEHPAVRFVELHIAPRLRGAWTLTLHQNDLRSPPWGMLRSTAPARVLALPGMQLHGTLDESDDDHPLGITTAFVALDGSQDEVTVAAPDGHWCTVRLQRDGVKISASLLDPQQRPCGCGAFADKPGSVRLWVPDGATGIEVRLEPGGSQRFEAAREEIAIR